MRSSPACPKAAIPLEPAADRKTEPCFATDYESTGRIYTTLTCCRVRTYIHEHDTSATRLTPQLSHISACQTIGGSTMQRDLPTLASCRLDRGHEACSSRCGLTNNLRNPESACSQRNTRDPVSQKMVVPRGSGRSTWSSRIYLCISQKSILHDGLTSSWAKSQFDSGFTEDKPGVAE